MIIDKLKASVNYCGSDRLHTLTDWKKRMEARVGIEPAYTELQSAA